MLSLRALSVVFLSFVLSGCVLGNTQSKVADLAGAVFVIFILITVSKYVGPKVFAWAFLARLRTYVSSVGSQLFFGSLVLALALSAYGFMNEILDRVLALVGLTLVVIAYHLKDIDSQDAVVRVRALDIVGLGLAITAALIALWVMGADLFRL